MQSENHKMFKIGDIVKFKGGSEDHQRVLWTIKSFDDKYGTVNIIYKQPGWEIIWSAEYSDLYYPSYKSYDGKPSKTV